MPNYTDLDLNFFRHPNSGDLSLVHGKDAINDSVRNLVLISRYERPFRGNLYCNIRKCLFELVTPMTAYIIRQEIVDVLKQYEPRIILQDVVVLANIDGNAYTVTIYYRIINQPDSHRVSVQLERLR